MTEPVAIDWDRTLKRVHAAALRYRVTHPFSNMDIGDIVGAGYEAAVETANRGIVIGHTSLQWAFMKAAKTQAENYTQRWRQLAMIVPIDEEPWLYETIPDGFSQIPGRRLMEDETSQLLDAALHELIPDEREAIVGHLCLGLQQTEIANLAGVPKMTIHRRIRRGLQKMRLALEQSGFRP